MRFLRFQAPWAYGRNLFVLLRRTQADNVANMCYQRMEMDEQWRVRSHIEAIHDLRDTVSGDVNDECPVVEGGA